MAISTNGTVIARLAGGLYNTVMSNATYLEVAAQDPSTLANTLYSRDFAKSTDLAVATTLVTNLGLSTVAGLDNWVAAQLTAAGSAKGAKIVSMLNDFAGMAADATYGAAATAFNTKVDAALAASQKTGSVEAKFEAAGTVASTAATFTLTTGVDSGALFTGGAGNDTFTATVATLGALDSIDGGAGTNTLSITDSVSIPSLPATVANIQVINATSTAGSVGNASSVAKVNAQQSVTYDLASIPSESLIVTVGGIAKTFTSGNLTQTAFRDWINEVMNDAYGVPTATSGLLGASGTYATFVSGSSTSVIVEADVAGRALPTIAVTKSNPATTTTLTVTPTVNRANQVAADAVSANTFTVPTGATSAAISAGTEAFVKSVSTADTKVVATAGTVNLSSGNSQTITAADSVTASGTKGAVSITLTKAAATELTAASAVTGWGGGAGVYVTGGSTVTISDKAGTASTTTGEPAANTKKIQVGSNPLAVSATNATDGAVPAANATGYPQTIAALSSAPTGDVSITKKSNYTDTKGYTNVKYGTGTVDVFMNGGSTATVNGAGATTIRDMQTITTKASQTADSLPGTSNLKTVNLSGISGAVGIYSDAIENLSVVDTASNQVVTINSNTGKNTGALNLTVGNSTVKVVAGQATSVAVNATTSSYQKIGGESGTLTLTSANTVELDAAKAKTLTIAGSSDVTLSSDSGLTALTTITSTSNKKVTVDLVTTAANFANVTKVDASGASGALTATIGATGDYGMTVTGGSGADKVTLKGTISSAAVNGVTVKTSIDLGAGNDKLVKGSSGAVAEGALVDGGEGIDNVDATFVTVDNAAIFKNFEVLDLAGFTSSIDASLLTGSTITGVAVTAATGGTATVTKIAGTSLAVSISAASATAGTVVASLADSTGTSDTAAVTFGATSAVTNQDVKAAALSLTGIETVTIASGGTLTYVDSVVLNELTSFVDRSNTTKTITITGSNQFTLGGFTQNADPTPNATESQIGALTSIDGSAATGALFITGGESTAKDGGTTYYTTFNGFTITGGSAADTLINKANGGVTNGGAGNDTIRVYGDVTAGGVKASANGGDGNDTIEVKAAYSTSLTGGAGKDTFDVTSAYGSANTTIITTINDFVVGEDKVKIGSVTPAFQKTAVVLSGSLQTQLNAVYAGLSAGEAEWFQFDGNTYIVADDASSHQVNVKLVGLLNLTTVVNLGTGLFGEA